MDTIETARPKIPTASYFGIFYAATVMILGMSLLQYINILSAGIVVYCSIIATAAVLMLTQRMPTPAVLIPIIIIAVGNLLVLLLDLDLLFSEISYLKTHSADDDLAGLFLIAAVLIYSLAHIAWGVHSAAVIFSKKNSIVCKLWAVPSVLLGISLVMVLTVLIPFGFLFLRAGISHISIMLSYGIVIICIEKFFFVFFTSKWLYSHIKSK